MKKILSVLLLLALACVLFACGTVGGYEIKFLVDGQTYKTIRVEEEASFSLPKAPEKDGYTFLRWELDGEEFTANNEITSNVEVTAVFKANKYKLSVGSERIDVTYGEPIGTLPSIPSKVGYETPSNWSIDGVEITPETVWNYTANKTAAAVYSPKEFTLTVGTNSVTVRYGQTIGTLPEIEKRAGNVAVVKIGNEEITTATLWTYLENKTAEVTYVPVTYHVTFATQTIDILYGETIGAKLPAAPQVQGYHDCKWAINGVALTEAYVFNLETDVTATIAKTPDTDTPYSVEHYKQNADNDGYTLVAGDTDDLTGTTDETTAAVAKTYEHYTALEIEQKAIAGDGTTVVKVYYDLDTITLTITEEGQANRTLSVKYGAKASCVPLPTKTNCTAAIYKDSSRIAGDFVFTEDATIAIVFEPYFVKGSAKGDAILSAMKNPDGFYLVENPGYDENSDSKEGNLSLIFSDIKDSNAFDFSFKVSYDNASDFLIGVQLFDSLYNQTAYYVVKYDPAHQYSGYLAGCDTVNWLWNDSGYAVFYNGTKETVESGEYYVKIHKEGKDATVFVGATLDSLVSYGFASGWNSFAGGSSIPGIQITSKAAGAQTVTISDVEYVAYTTVTYVAAGEEDQVKPVAVGTKFESAPKASKLRYTAIYTMNGEEVSDDFVIEEAITVNVEYVESEWFTIDTFKGEGKHGTVKNQDGSFTVNNPGFADGENGRESILFSALETAESFDFSFKVKYDDASQFEIGVQLFDASYTQTAYYVVKYDPAHQYGGYLAGCDTVRWLWNDSGYAVFYNGTKEAVESGEYYVKIHKEGVEAEVFVGATLDSMVSYGFDSGWNSFAGGNAIPAVWITSKAAGEQTVTVSDVEYVPYVKVTYVASGEADQIKYVKKGAKFESIEKASKPKCNAVYKIDDEEVADDFVIDEDLTINVEYTEITWFTIDDFKGDGTHGTVKNQDGSFTVNNPGNGGSVALAITAYQTAEKFEISFKVTGSDPTKFDIGVRLYNADYTPWLSHFIPLYSENYVRGEQVFNGWGFNDSGYAVFYGNTKNALESGAYYVKYVKDGTKSWLYVGASLDSMDCYSYDNETWNCFAPQIAVPTVEIKSKADGEQTVTISEIEYKKNA